MAKGAWHLKPLNLDRPILARTARPTIEPGQRAEVRIEPQAEEASRARQKVRKWLTARGIADVQGHVLVVVGELVGNAVRHAAENGPVTVRIGVSGKQVLVEVRDGSHRPPMRSMCPGGNAESGRGLVLVEALAARWGWAAEGDGGKTVWALVGTEEPFAPALLPVCGERARLPDDVVPAALAVAPPGTMPCPDEVDRDLRCTLQAHLVGDHYAYVLHLESRRTGSVWAHWPGTPGNNSPTLVVLPDCPGTAPAPPGRKLLPIRPPPGGHYWELTDPWEPHTAPRAEES